MEILDSDFSREFQGNSILIQILYPWMSAALPKTFKYKGLY